MQYGKLEADFLEELKRVEYQRVIRRVQYWNGGGYKRHELVTYMTHKVLNLFNSCTLTLTCHAPTCFFIVNSIMLSLALLITLSPYLRWRNYYNNQNLLNLSPLTMLP